MPSGPVILIALAGALTYYLGVDIVHGAKWVGHKAKHAGTAIVHTLKKVAKPFHEYVPTERP